MAIHPASGGTLAQTAPVVMSEAVSSSFNLFNSEMDSNTDEPRVPRRRWLIVTLLGFGVFVKYLDRVNISVSQEALHTAFRRHYRDLRVSAQRLRLDLRRASASIGCLARSLWCPQDWVQQHISMERGFLLRGSSLQCRKFFCCAAAPWNRGSPDVPGKFQSSWLLDSST